MPTKKKYIPRNDWLALRREYIERNLDGEIMSLRDFSQDKNLNWGTVRNKAAEAKWLDELEERLDVKNTKELAEVKKAHERAMVRLRSMAANEEVGVRSRHAAQGRALQKKAYDRIRDMPLLEITPASAIQLMRLGIDIEKHALGLSDRLETGHSLTNPQEEMEHMVNTRRAITTADVDSMLTSVLEKMYNEDAPEDESFSFEKPVEAAATH